MVNEEAGAFRQHDRGELAQHSGDRDVSAKDKAVGDLHRAGDSQPSGDAELSV